MAMITSQGQRLAQLEALTKENQNLRANLEAAQRRIKELETLSVPPAAAPTTLTKPKTSPRTGKAPTKRQLQVAARTFAPPPANNGYARP
ncbi:hypothetical protein G6F55_013582 [Rhizopus delemar]|uniref:Uncharacterized protein n=2 Tax=Rhizopus TaxID=4842 RepID=A0A9P7C4W2_9FUNG|nr:hypothetical protein G6F55_013582 [Rhizopus delemar]KAG1530341.1 hypothetical protein G6F51_013868 [Rhizopus arrhizus]KAG1535862.1 hypothetical protein G6F50_015204 [Rhizopus delemar]